MRAEAGGHVPMKRDEKLIRELEREILETNACISEVQSTVWRLPDTIPPGLAQTP
jgi:hypothetical protein